MGLTRGRSTAVKTRLLASGGTVMDLMRAWACGLRTNATSIVPGNLTSATNWPRPCRCRSSSLRSSEAPTPNRSSGIGCLLSNLLGRLGDCGDDVGVAGAAAAVAGKPLADFMLRLRALPQDQVARGDQHCRRAVTSLPCLVLVKVSPQHTHDLYAD